MWQVSWDGQNLENCIFTKYKRGLANIDVLKLIWAYETGSETLDGTDFFLLFFAGFFFISGAGIAQILLPTWAKELRSNFEQSVCFFNLAWYDLVFFWCFDVPEIFDAVNDEAESGC